VAQLPRSLCRTSRFRGNAAAATVGVCPVTAASHPAGSLIITAQRCRIMIVAAAVQCPAKCAPVLVFVISQRREAQEAQSPCVPFIFDRRAPVGLDPRAGEPVNRYQRTRFMIFTGVTGLVTGPGTGLPAFAANGGPGPRPIAPSGGWSRVVAQECRRCVVALEHNFEEVP
jgi:hypothetical protein